MGRGNAQSKRKAREALQATMKAAIAKADRLNAGEFDGLYGRLPDGAAVLLEAIVEHLRDYLLDEKGLSEAEVKRLLKGLRLDKPISDGAELAIDLLNYIASVMRLDKRVPGRAAGLNSIVFAPRAKNDRKLELLSGKYGASGLKLKAGRSKAHASRRKNIDGGTPLQRKICELARNDGGTERGRNKRIAIACGCRPQYVGRVLKDRT